MIWQLSKLRRLFQHFDQSFQQTHSTVLFFCQARGSLVERTSEVRFLVAFLVVWSAVLHMRMRPAKQI